MRSLLQAYFDRVYNPVYDYTTATLTRYRRLQDRCLELLDLPRGRRLLCIGLGTGNEAAFALRIAPRISITGVDTSRFALAAARRKVRAAGRDAELLVMDASKLSFADGAFDRVLCMHVLDFVQDVERTVREAVRVLGPGGRLVLTLPSRAEGPSMGAALVGDQVHASLRNGRNPLAVAADIILKIPLGLIYLPLFLRPARRSFSRTQVEALFQGCGIPTPRIEEEPAYQDYIVTAVRS